MARRFSGPRLREARVNAGLTTTQLAAAAGCAEVHIRGVEAERWGPSVALLAALASVLDTGVDEFFDHVHVDDADPGPVAGRRDPDRVAA